VSGRSDGTISGEILVDDNGKERVLVVEEDPESRHWMSGVDPRLMTVGQDLRDLSFFDTPSSRDSGGNEVMEAAEGMGREAFGDGSWEKLAEAEAEISANDRRIEELLEETARYGEYVSQREAVKERLLAERDDSEKEGFDKVRASHKKDYDRLSELSAARRSLGRFRYLDESAMSRLAVLRKGLRDSEEGLEALDSTLASPRAVLGGRDPSKVLFYAEDIGLLEHGCDEYERISGLLKARRQELAVNVVGSGRADRLHETPELIEEVEALAEKTAAYEDSVSRVVSGLGMGVGETAHAVADLVRLRDSAQTLVDSEKEVRRRVSERDRARRALESFEAEFGGKDGLEACVALSERARTIDGEAFEIRRCISEDGLDPDAPVCPAEYLGASDGKAALKRRLEELDATISRIERSEELERLFDRRAELAFRRTEVLREGIAAAVAAHMARAMARRSSPLTELAWEGADAFLSFIMDADCFLDRRDGEFFIRSGDMEVPVAEAGSGISSAACLSLRTAAVENLSGGALPLVLDEALSDMDLELRRRACRLLSQISGRLQVVVLTCDPEVKGILSRIPGANVVNMPRTGLRRL
ncbi:MAG: hypothetical protein J6Z16_02935, partial [Candidatus Methanomethylophilaceae archaeon]|nr:hypothetical protein [Candidatus Methanomethylophilaceae archaeon]